MAMRDDRRAKAEKSKHAEWEQIYGPPEPDWPVQLLGLLKTANPARQREALHIRAIRDMLYYCEGDGREFGDRPYWDGDRTHYGARQFDLEHYPELMAKVRAAGGWRTERELQMDWVDL